MSRTMKLSEKILNLTAINKTGISLNTVCILTVLILLEFGISFFLFLILYGLSIFAIIDNCKKIISIAKTLNIILIILGIGSFIGVFVSGESKNLNQILLTCSFISFALILTPGLNIKLLKNLHNETPSDTRPNIKSSKSHYLKPPNIIGALIGILFGISEGADLANMENLPISTEDMYVILGFSVVGPCLSAIANTIFFRNIFKFMEKINSAVGFYALMITFCMTASLYGLTLQPESGFNLISPISIFFSAGVGFFLAYWLDAKFGYWYMRKSITESKPPE